MEFLEKHKELVGWNGETTTPYTIHEEEDEDLTALNGSREKGSSEATTPTAAAAAAEAIELEGVEPEVVVEEEDFESRVSTFYAAAAAAGRTRLPHSSPDFSRVLVEEREKEQEERRATESDGGTDQGREGRGEGEGEGELISSQSASLSDTWGTSDGNGVWESFSGTKWSVSVHTPLSPSRPSGAPFPEVAAPNSARRASASDLPQHVNTPWQQLETPPVQHSGMQLVQQLGTNPVQQSEMQEDQQSEAQPVPLSPAAGLHPSSYFGTHPGPFRTHAPSSPPLPPPPPTPPPILRPTHTEERGWEGGSGEWGSAGGGGDADGNPVAGRGDESALGVEVAPGSVVVGSVLEEGVEVERGEEEMAGEEMEQEQDEQEEGEEEAEEEQKADEAGEKQKEKEVGEEQKGEERGENREEEDVGGAAGAQAVNAFLDDTAASSTSTVAAAAREVEAGRFGGGGNERCGRSEGWQELAADTATVTAAIAAPTTADVQESTVETPGGGTTWSLASIDCSVEAVQVDEEGERSPEWCASPREVQEASTQGEPPSCSGSGGSGGGGTGGGSGSAGTGNNSHGSDGDGSRGGDGDSGGNDDSRDCASRGGDGDEGEDNQLVGEDDLGLCLASPAVPEVVHEAEEVLAGSATLEGDGSGDGDSGLGGISGDT